MSTWATKAVTSIGTKWALAPTHHWAPIPEAPFPDRKGIHMASDVTSDIKTLEMDIGTRIAGLGIIQEQDQMKQFGKEQAEQEEKRKKEENKHGHFIKYPPPPVSI